MKGGMEAEEERREEGLQEEVGMRRGDQGRRRKVKGREGRKEMAVERRRVRRSTEREGEWKQHGRKKKLGVTRKEKQEFSF